MTEKLLLHVCCGPCLSGAHKALMSDDLDITGFFYNPNIHPREEYDLRVKSVEKYSDIKKFDMLIADHYDIDNFKKQVVDMPGDRCVNCYRLRLERTAYCAKQNKYDMFSTTILISPHQKHEHVKRVGQELAAKYQIPFLYADLRPHYKDSVAISKELGLYRQKYCGCYLSKAEAT